MLAAFAAAAAAATSQAHDVWGTGVNTTGWAVFAITDFAIGGLTKAPDAQVEVIVEPKLSSGRPEVSHLSKVLYGSTSGVFDLHIYLPADSSAVTVNLYDYCSWQEPGELIFTTRYDLADCPAEQSATQGCALAWQEPVELPPLLAAKQFRPWHPWAASPGERSARLLGYHATGAEMVSRVRVASRRGVGVQFEDVSRDPARFALGRIQNDAIEAQLFFAEAGSVFPEALHGLWWMDQRGVSLKDGPYPSDPEYTQVCLGAAEENLISFGEASWDNETRCASGVRQYSGGPLSGHWTWFDESGNGESKPWSKGADWILKYEFCFSGDDFDKIDVRTKITNDALGEITLPTFATMVRTSWGWDRVTTIPDAPAKLTEFLKTASIDSGLADWVQAKFGPGYGDFAASGFACHYPVRQVIDGTGKRTDAYSEYLAYVNMQTDEYSWTHISYNGIKYAENIIHPTELGVHANDYDGYAVINEEALNAWGVPRGYEIVPLSTTARQVLPDDHPLMAAGGWMKHNIMVTARKDEEELATVPSNFNIGVPTPERYNMDAFLNSEPIVKQDLVTWITVGRQHYPKAEDVPVVSNFGVGFSLKPRNFYAAAAFKDLPAAQESEYGARVEACAPPKQAPR